MTKSQIAVLGLIAGLAVALFASPSLASWDDGLRHFRLAHVMLKDGIPQTWQRFFSGGYLSTHNVDPWFLADVSYIPFTIFPDVLALKLYALVAATVLFVVLRRMIKPLALPDAWEAVVLVTLFASPTFFGRLEFARPFVWQTTLCLLAVDAVLRRKPIMLGVVLMIATLFSHLFVFPLAIAFAGVAWIMATGRGRSCALLGCGAIAGTALGIFLYPNSAAYTSYIFTTFFRIPFSTGTVNLAPEMFPGAWVDLSPALLACILLFLVIGHGTAGKRFPLKEFHERGGTLIAALAIVSLLSYLFAWARMIDLAWPLLILLAAYLLSFLQESVTELLEAPKKILGIRPATLLVSLLIAVSLTSVITSSLRNIRETGFHNLANLKPIADLPAGSRILNIDYRVFSSFMMTNPTLRFATGIDNTFTVAEDPRAYVILETLRNPASDLSPDDVHALMRELLQHFPSEYVVITATSEHLLPSLRTMPNFKEVTASDGFVHVFKVGMSP